MTTTPVMDRRVVSTIRLDDAYELLGLRPDIRGPIVAFKLCMVPEPIRMAAARSACVALSRIGGWEALDLSVEIRRRALFPSDATYRISRRAWEAVMG